MPPVISVVIPCYNAAAWIGETLESVRLQSAVVADIVVVDDGSDDESMAIVERAALPGLRVLRQMRLGASRARNVGTAATSAPFVQYLDADDVLLAGTLRERLNALEQSGADVAYTNWVRWEQQADGSFREGTAAHRVLGERPDAEILVDAWWPPGALLYRRTLVERVLPWREDLPVIQDARFLLDAALVGGRFVHVDRTGLRYRVHGDQSLSRRDPRAFLDDCHRSITDIDERWTRAQVVDPPRHAALVKCYAFLARSYFPVDRERFRAVTRRLHELEPGFIPESPADFRALARLVGYARAEYLAAWLRPLLRLTTGRGA